MLKLQEQLNRELTEAFESSKHLGREKLASSLVVLVEEIVDRLNSEGWKFGLVDYGGDVTFEYSEQTFSDGAEMGYGTILKFYGFSCQVCWSGRDKYR